jgi:hypothetical protein
VDKTRVIINATSTRSSIVEIGEQLAWLCAALKWSPSESDMAYSTAEITATEPASLTQALSQPQAACFELSSDFKVLSGDDLRTDVPGHCWHLLFNNPVIVQGYPIPIRSHNEIGLELSPSLMASLGDANYLTDFHNTPVLKGFSTMFIMTGSLEDSVIWHFKCDLDGNRISYSEALYSPMPHSHNFEMTVCTRNFVGWATSVNRFAGKLYLSTYRRPIAAGEMLTTFW